MAKRRSLSNKFKVVVAIEALRGDKNAQGIAARHKIQPCARVEARKRAPFEVILLDQTGRFARQCQPRLADGAQHVAWLAGAGRPDFPAVAVLRVAAGATMRQACTATGIDPAAPLVGIPAAAFAE